MTRQRDDLIYAIDFGTSNSLLAAATPDQIVSPIRLDDLHGDPTILRSTMYFPKDGAARFGQEAIRLYLDESGEGRFIRSIKKFLPSKGFTSTQIGGMLYDLKDLISCFLREMKTRGDRHFDSDVRSVVLGRPAKFSADPDEDALAQKRLKEAALEAGFEHIEFFPEPLAAAFDYRQTVTQEKLVLIVDLGGGTSDFTVIRLHPDQFNDEDVLALGGISIAGDALDGQIMGSKIAPYFGSSVTYQLPMSRNVLEMPPSLKFRLMSPAEITLMSRSDIMQFLNNVRKCTLRSDDDLRLDRLFTLINENLGFLVFDEIESCKRAACTEGKGSFHFSESGIILDESLTYEEFNQISEEKISSIFATLDEVIKMSGVHPDDIDLICQTGGTAKVPAIREQLNHRFGAQKIQTVDSFHSVIRGLSQKAKSLLGS